MQMTGSNGVLSVPSEHLPGLVALVLVGPLIWLALAAAPGALDPRRSGPAGAGPARRPRVRAPRSPWWGPSSARWSTPSSCPPTGATPALTALLFVVDAVGFAVAFWWTFISRRHWRLVSAAMLGGHGLRLRPVHPEGLGDDGPGRPRHHHHRGGGRPGGALARRLAPPPARAVRRSALAALPVAMLSLLGTNVIAGDEATGALAAGRLSGAVPSPATPALHQDPRPRPWPACRLRLAPARPPPPLSLPTTSPAGQHQWPDDMSTMAAGMKMAEPNCTAQPTAAQQQAAVTLVDQTVAAAQKYTSLAAAKAAGYVPVTPSGARIVHYINPTIYRPGRRLDPDAIPALVYVNTSHGAVLSAAMYLVPVGAATAPAGWMPDPVAHPHGPVLQRRQGRRATTPARRARAGSMNKVTQPMMHVWMTPVSGGPLAPDPPPLNEVEAAVEGADAEPPERRGLNAARARPRSSGPAGEDPPRRTSNGIVGAWVTRITTSWACRPPLRPTRSGRSTAS